MQAKRKLIRTTKFKKDLKKFVSDLIIDDRWIEALYLLQRDQALPKYLEDHPLKGTLAGMRSCHIKPDLCLIYTKEIDGEIGLIRLQSHSELYGN